MASCDTETFRYWQPRPLVQKFDTIHQKSEEDLRASILEAKEQQKTVVHKSSTTLSTSTTTRDDRRPHPVHRVHDILRRRSRKLRHSFLSMSDSSHTDARLDDASQDAQSLRSAVSALTPANLSEQNRTQSPLSHFNDYPTAYDFPLAKPELYATRDVVRGPAQKEGRKLAKERKDQQKFRRRLERNTKEHFDNYQRHELADFRTILSSGTAATAAEKSNSSSSWSKTFLRLGTRSRRDKDVIPRPGDFSSKADLHAYLNPMPSSPALQQPVIAELPAGPPPYNPLESAELPNPNNAQNPSHSSPPYVASLNDSRPITAGAFLPEHSDASSRPMICDSCYAPIRSAQRYHYCAVCNGGNRIVCISCSDAGRRCRHDLTERISSVRRAQPSDISPVPVEPAPVSSPISKTVAPSPGVLATSATAGAAHPNRFPSMCAHLLSPTNDTEYTEAKTTFEGFEAFQRAEAMVRKSGLHAKKEAARSFRKREEQLKADQATVDRRDECLQFKERELSLREREANLRDRECSLREQQAALRDQETASRVSQMHCMEKALSEPVTSSLSGAITRSLSFEKSDDALFQAPIEEVRVPVTSFETQTLGAQANASTPALLGHFPNEIKASKGSQILLESDSEDYKQNDMAVLCKTLAEALRLSVHDCDNIRSHAQTGAKRKATSQCRPPPASSGTHSTNGQFHSRTPSGSGSSNGEDEDEDQTPKRKKPESPSPVGVQRLLACPYAKYDPVRYSERNQTEKSYRGCAVKYLTDISRLKQHLYRVHRRPEHHCARCFEVFKSKHLLDVHSRSTVACEVAECTFEEQFAEDKEKELRRKRPNKGIEESWFFIYSVLFPDINPPESPYIDNTTLAPTAGRSGSAKDQTPILLEIFNEQLTQSQEAVNITCEQRELINQTLRRSMAEMLQRISPTNTPSVSRTPSIFISPISAQPRSGFQTPTSSLPSSPVSQKHSPARRNMPYLSPLQTRGVKGLNAVQQVTEEAFKGSRDAVNFSRPTSANSDHGGTSPMDFDLPNVADLERLLAKDHSTQLDTDIGLAVSDIDLDFEFDFHVPGLGNRNQLSATSSSPSPRHVSVPPRVPSQADFDVDNNLAGVTPLSLRQTSSKRSIDSGYGSMHSRAGRVKRDLDEAPPSPRVDVFHDQNSCVHLRTTQNAKLAAVPIAENVDYSFLDRGLYETLGAGQDLDDQVMDEYGTQYWNGCPT